MICPVCIGYYVIRALAKPHSTFLKEFESVHKQAHKAQDVPYRVFIPIPVIPLRSIS